MSDYQLLLERVGLLYEKHEAGRRKPFNVFSVLRSPSDEVTLHSRFLHALLDWKSPGAERENLKDFLQHVAEKEFEEKGTKVRREYDNIDILITNDAQQAVAIENKIEARDGDRQLEKYYKALRKEGYNNIHFLYLTLHGNDPSDGSRGDLDGETISPISYKDDLLPWLECCQKRAYDEPTLRESVAQYRQLVRKLTGTDLTEAYMSELKKLLEQGNNLALASDLIKATTEVHIDLLKELWEAIESELNKAIPDLPEKSNRDSDVSRKRIGEFVRSQRYSKDHGLYYPFGSGTASLGVQVAHKIFFGVCCSEREYDKLENALHGVSGGDPWAKGGWPWHKYVNDNLNLKDPTHETWEMLSNKEKSSKYVAEIAAEVADGLKKVWKRLKARRLAP